MDIITMIWACAVSWMLHCEKETQLTGMYDNEKRWLEADINDIILAANSLEMDTTKES
jgi:hypothetical protein